jgi:hypothetical protein
MTPECLLFVLAIRGLGASVLSMLMTRFVLTLLVGLVVLLGALVSGVEPVLAKNWNTGKKEINLDAFTEFRTGLIETQGQSHSALTAFNQGKSFSGFWAKGIVFFDGKLCSWSSEITNTNLMTGSLAARCPDNWSFKGTYAQLGNSRGAKGDGLDNSGKQVNFKFDGRGSSSLKKAKSYYITTFPNPYGLSAKSPSAAARPNANGGVISRGTLANLDRSTLCLSAVDPYTKTWSEAVNYRKYVQEAKSRGLTCGVDEPTQTALTSSSNSSNQATQIATNRKLADKHRVDSGRIVPLETYWPHEIECKLDAGSGLPNRLFFNKDAVNLGVDTGLVGLILPLQTTLTSDKWQALLDERGKAVLIVEYGNSNVKKANYKCNKTSSEVIKLASQYPVSTETEIAERERKEKEKAEAEAQQLAEVEAKRLAEEKKKEEAAKKAAELAAKKKEEAARKAAELAAKKKEEEAKKAAELAEALGEASEFYSDFISFVKSGKDADVVRSAELFKTKPEINEKWTKAELEQYRKFKKAALEIPDFFVFYQGQVQSRLKAISDKRAKIQMALNSMDTKLLSIITESFGSKDADQALELRNKLSRMLKSFDQFTLQNLNDAENEIASFLSKLEKRQQTKQLVLKEREKAIGILEAKLTDLEKLVVNHFGEPKSEKAASLIKKIELAKGYSISQLSQLMSEVGVVLPAAFEEILRQNSELQRAGALQREAEPTLASVRIECEGLAALEVDLENDIMVSISRIGSFDASLSGKLLMLTAPEGSAVCQEISYDVLTGEKNAKCMNGNHKEKCMITDIKVDAKSKYAKLKAEKKAADLAAKKKSEEAKKAADLAAKKKVDAAKSTRPLNQELVKKFAAWSDDEVYGLMSVLANQITMVQVCYEVREGYLQVYITRNEHDQGYRNLKRLWATVMPEFLEARPLLKQEEIFTNFDKMWEGLKQPENRSQYFRMWGSDWSSSTREECQGALYGLKLAKSPLEFIN